MVAKYTNDLQDSSKANNTPNSTNKILASNVEAQKFKPNTAANRTLNDYTNPNFLTHNIINTVNKTVYKARVAALGSRGKTNSNSNQKDTTILDKKVIV